MRVLVCGGRDYADAKTMYVVLKSLSGATTIIHGACEGADAMAETVADNCALSTEPYPADWDTCGEGCPDDKGRHRKMKKTRAYCPYAGPRRNRKMLAEGRPQLVIAFPGGRGTASMVTLAKKAGIPVMEVRR